MKTIMKTTLLCAVILINNVIYSQEFDGSRCISGKRLDGSSVYLDIFNHSEKTGGKLSISDVPRYIWQFKKTDEGYFYIINMKSGLYLEIQGTNAVKGSKIIQNVPKGNDVQKWEILPAGDDRYYILPKINNNLLLTVTGPNVWLKPFNDSDKKNDIQKWEIGKCILRPPNIRI